MREFNQAYYSKRAKDELFLAEVVPHPAAAAAHKELAGLYLKMLAGRRADPVPMAAERR